MQLHELIDQAAAIAGSQRKLAAVLGATPGNVSDWRAGTRPCPDKHIVAMARMVPGDTRKTVAEVYLARLGKLALISLAGIAAGITLTFGARDAAAATAGANSKAPYV